MTGKRLVGRERELETVQRMLDGLERGGVSVLAVAGEPGIGKTRMLFELAERARARGYEVLEGRAMEFESEIPFAPVTAALDDVVGGLDGKRLALLGEDRLAELRRILPSMGGVGSDPAGVDAERYRLHRAVRLLLEAVAGPGPLVVILDDMHWADAATLELLTYLLHRPPRADLLLALGYRDRQVSDRLVAALDAAVVETVAVEVQTLSPLTEEETDELLAGASLDAAFRREVHARSGGNPFYAEQLARAGVPSVREEVVRKEEFVPRGLVAAVAMEIEALGADATAFLRGCAVAGDPFDVDLAAAAADVTDGVPELLDALEAADLVRHVGPGARFRFRHPIVRAAVYEGAGGRWRIDAHRRVAAELESRGAPPSARAHHVERAALPGDEHARQTLLAAAAEASARAPTAAVRWYEAALRLTPQDTEKQLEILISLSGAHAAAGSRELAHARVLDALRVTPADDIDRRVELTALCAGFEYQIGRPAEANARLVAALASLPEGASRARAALEIELAVQPAYLSSWRDVRALGERALATATASGDIPLTASASAALALGATFMGRYDVASSHTDEAVVLVDAASDALISTRLDALHHLGAAEAFLDRYEPARRHLNRGLALSRATRNGRFLPPLLASVARLDAIHGRFGRARDGVERAVDIARVGGDTQMIVWALMFVVLVELIAGNPADAEGPALESYALAQTLDHSVIAASAIANYAAVCGGSGEHDRCVALMHEADVLQTDGPHHAQDWEVLVRSLVELERLDDAAVALDQVRARLTAWDPPMVRGCVDRAEAVLALAQGDAERATRFARRAVEEASACGAVVDAARSRILVGRGLHAAGAGDAVAELERAYNDLDAIDAIGHRDVAARELRRLGRHVQRRGRRLRGEAGTGSLSEREREVAELAAEGLTNKEIAARLYVSDKTVESHLSRTFEKLGIPNRAAIATKLARV